MTRPAGILIAARGPWRLAGEQAKRFAKEVLRVGRWIHPVTGQLVAFARADLERLAADTNRWIALGHRVWFPTGSAGVPAHNAVAENSLGEWLSFAVDGDALVGEVSVEDPGAIPKIGRTIKDVSASIRFDVAASSGERFDAVIEHVAATPAPVIPGQANFVALAREVVEGDMVDQAQNAPPAAGAKKLSLGETLLAQFTPEEQAAIGEKIEKLVAEGKPRDQAIAQAIRAVAPEKSKAMSLMAHGSPAEAIRSLLGLAPDADAGAVMDAVRKAIGEGAAGAPPAGNEPAEDEEMAKKELERLEGRIKELEAENTKVRTAAATREIELAREATAAAGIPLDEDTRKEVAALFAAGHEAPARRILRLAIERAEDRKSVLREGVQFLRSGAERALDRSEVEAEKAKRDMLLSQGYTVEMAPDGRIARAIPPGRAKKEA